MEKVYWFKDDELFSLQFFVLFCFVFFFGKKSGRVRFVLF